MKKVYDTEKSIYQKIKLLTCQQITIDEVHDQFDLVVQIQKYFIEWVQINYHQKILIHEQMKTIGWKFGITFLWNIIVMKQVNLQN
jgi:hypothetical protein